MKSPPQLNLFGVYRPRPRAPGFAIPVFRDDSGLWVQKVGDERVEQFVRCDVDVDQLLPAPMNAEREPWIQRVADPAIYAFQMADGHVEIGSRESLSPSLVKEASPLTNPFVSLDVAEFVGDAKLQREARSACDRVLGREAPPLNPAAKYATVAEHVTVATPVQTAAAAAGVSMARTDINRRHLLRVAFATLAIIALSVPILLRSTNIFSGGKTRDSLAVLRFDNVSQDPKQDYLSDGIPESLINDFTQLPNFNIISSAKAFSYDGAKQDPKQVARELGVDAVLIGRVLHKDNNLMVQVDLLNGENGSRLWTQQYERDFNNLAQVQEDISRNLVQELRLKLTDEQSSRLTKRYASNSEAYQRYLMGRYYWNKRTSEALTRAAEQFQAAIDKEPNYALAYSGLADCYLLLEEYAGVPISATLPKAKAAAERALYIDDSLAEAHTSLAKAHQHSWEWSKAEIEFKRAIELNPKYPTARQWYSSLLIDLGRLDEAHAEIKAAQQLDPISPIITGNVGYTYFLKGDLASAQTEYSRILESAPNFPMGHAVLGLLYLREARNEAAIAELQKAVDFSGRSGHALSALGYAYAVSGKPKDARLILQELEVKYHQNKTAATNLAGVFAGLGEKDQAFTWLEKDFQARSYELTRLVSEPLFDGLRSDTRYTNLLQRMGLAR